MKSFLFGAAIVLSLGSLPGMAQDRDLVEGTYVTTGASHYQDGAITISPWGGETFTMTAMLIDGDRLYETEAFLEPQGNGYFRGSGTITVRYSENRGCTHRFGVTAIVEDGAIFLRENMPEYIPYNPNGPCTAAGPYVWFNHEEPYVLNAEG